LTLCASFLQVLRLMTMFQSGPRLGSSHPLEADRVASGKGTDQPPVRMHHHHLPTYLPATAAGGGRGWVGQHTTCRGPRTQGTLPTSEPDFLGFEPPLTGTLSCPSCCSPSSLGWGFSGPRSPHYAHSSCIVPGPAPPPTAASCVGSGKAQALVPCPGCLPRCLEHFSICIL
jgi:hypothetical protein